MGRPFVSLLASRRPDVVEGQGWDAELVLGGDTGTVPCAPGLDLPCLAIAAEDRAATRAGCQERAIRVLVRGHDIDRDFPDEC
jgi:hypothetical protein